MGIQSEFGLLWTKILSLKLGMKKTKVVNVISGLGFLSSQNFSKC